MSPAAAGAAPPRPTVRATETGTRAPTQLTPPSRVAGVATLVWSASLPAAGALSVATAWGGWRMPLVVIGAVVLPFVLLLAVLRAGVPRWLGTTVLVALLVLVCYVLAVDSGGTLSGTVRDAVPRLLTEPQPLAFRADLLVVPVLACGLVGLLVALRSARPARVAPVVGAAVLYAGGALLTGGRGDRIGLVAVLVLLLTVLGWVLLDETGEPRSRRTLVVGPLLVVGVGFVASSALVPTERPFDPRAVVEPPVFQTEVASPLPQLAAWTANPDVELFTTSGDSAPMRLVVLDDYDGAQWRAATRYGPLGIEAEETLPAGADRARFTVAVRVAELGGSWLPSPGDPTGATGTETLVDPRTGTVLAPGGAGGAEYEITGVVDAADPATLPDARLVDPEVEPVVEQYLATPTPLPYELGAYAASVVEGTVTPYQRALAIEQAVRGERALSDRAISGSALWRVEDFLLGDPATTAGAQEGTSEQFATAFAVIARHTGLPTRVVVGFRPGDERPDGTRVVRGEHALAWPEVYFSGLGWVPFNPTPEQDFFGERPEAPPPPPETVPADETPQFDEEQEALDTDDPGPEATAGQTWWDRWAGYALVGGLVVGVPLLLLLARLVRSTLHRTRGAAGAWAEVLDGLVLAGRPARASQTAPELGDHLAMRFSAPGAVALARDADAAAFAPAGGDAADGSAGRSEGRERRRRVREVRRALRRSVPLWRRAWWAFDPRVLRPRPRADEPQAARRQERELTRAR
ncbi:transglutaminaseTgpA domain-containing protein [Nocardioides zeae]|uniref:TransglutaminaseTgpA domain-containing protein n=1 Tax=Nocardioides imazamoxiresistens TaxID=3231893 RepID=A0ABU3PRR3_9ACTN|nr:transglutaminaseTgpA domain-containing protein [Nocardioides zeae]MDT9591883.1 transglutaminaseTgpA domain-containing protein [Nocardioides zeae]